MKIILGSGATEKLEYVRKAFSEIHIKADIEGIEVDSEITDQPLDIKTTKLGAKNRAKNAKKNKPNADFWIGLEGGLHDYGGGYHLVTFACLIDKSGNEYFGNGTEIHLPESVSDEVKKGGKFGEEIRKYAKENELDQNLISRERPFIQAVKTAYLASINPSIKMDDTFTLTWIPSESPTDFYPITQVYGICFDKKGQILICRSSKTAKWQLPGGSPEEGETLKQTLIREIEEEVDVRVKSVKLIGFQRVDQKNNPYKHVGDIYYQARCYCEVDKINDQTPDPATGSVWERKWVSQEKTLDYIRWKVVGEAMFAEAIINWKNEKT